MSHNQLKHRRSLCQDLDLYNLIAYLHAIPHCDLFFADAAILIEGAAERMLIPYFIRHFKKLNGSYLSLLEIGGSHAHRLKPLIEHLGLITLIITDLDSVDPSSNKSAIPPIRGKKYITNNDTLKTWIPQNESIDELLDMAPSQKTKKYNEIFYVRVAYQCPVEVEIENKKQEAIPYTYEDALVFDNLNFFKDIDGSGLINKFKEAINTKTNAKDLGTAMFEALRKGDKAKFALELLYLRDPKELKVPKYINEGLSWLQDQLEIKQKDILLPKTDAQGEQDDAK